MTTVAESTARHAAALAGAPDPYALSIVGRVQETLDRAERPLSGRDVCRRTYGRTVSIEGALWAMADAGTVLALPRRAPGAGTTYVLPDRRAA